MGDPCGATLYDTLRACAEATLQDGRRSWKAQLESDRTRCLPQLLKPRCQPRKAVPALSGKSIPIQFRFRPVRREKSVRLTLLQVCRSQIADVPSMPSASPKKSDSALTPLRRF